MTTDDGRYVLDWHIALMRGAERDVLRIRAELEAQGLRYNEEIGKWEETDVFASRYDRRNKARPEWRALKSKTSSTPK